MKKNLTLIDTVLFLLCFFPYLTLIETPFDTQPYALLFGSFLLVIKYLLGQDLKIPNVAYMYILVFIYAIVSSLFVSTFFESIRSLIGYISVPIFMVCAYNGMKHVNPKLLNIVVTIWLFFGLIQTFINRSFGHQLLSRMSTSLDRGVTSLAVEPSYYAILCVFILVFNSLFYGKNSYGKKSYCYIFIVSSIQILLSKSAMGIMLYLVYLINLFLFSENLKIKIKQLLLVMIVAVPSLFFVRRLQISDSRIGTLLNKLDLGIANLILKDGSISDRLSHILVSFASLFHSYGVGFGLGNWNEKAFYISQNSGQTIKNISEVNFTLGRIMSGWGTAVFELGIIGIFFIFGYIYIIIKNSKLLDKKNKFLIYSTGCTVFILMLTSVPLTYPLFGYYMGTILDIKKENSLRSL